MTQPVGIFVGLTVLDLVHHVTTLPGANEKITAKSQFLAAGGPAANAAVTFAALGGRATLVTALGTTQQAQIARADLEKHGVEIKDVGPPDFELSVSAVTVLAATGDRSVTSLDGGTTTVSAAGISDHLVPADVLLIDGHHPELARAAVEHYRGTSTEVIMDAGRWKPHYVDLLPHTDTIISSADFTVPDPLGSLPRTLDDDLAPTDLFAGTRFARTGGEHPITWWQRNPDGTTPAGQVVPPTVRAVDTLGAGDIFHGAYAFYSAHNFTGNDRVTAQKRDFAVLLGQASEVAAHRVQCLGPRQWISTLGPKSLPPESSKTRQRN